MTEKKFRTITKTHFDDDGFGPTPPWGTGKDTLDVDVPDGQVFTRYELVDQSQLGGARVVKAPSRGSKGKVRCQVAWNYALLGKASYTLQCYCAKTASGQSSVTVSMLEVDWGKRALQAIEQGARLRILASGAEAMNLISVLFPGSRETVSQRARDLSLGERSVEPGIVDKDPETGTEITYTREVVTGATIAISAIALTALAVVSVTLAYVVGKAIEAGRSVKAEHRGKFGEFIINIP